MFACAGKTEPPSHLILSQTSAGNAEKFGDVHVPPEEVSRLAPLPEIWWPGKNVSIARLTEWRGRALTGAATALKERERDDRDDEIARLKSKVGEITMDNELLNAKIAALEGKRPLAHRRSRGIVTLLGLWAGICGRKCPS